MSADAPTVVRIESLDGAHDGTTMTSLCGCVRHRLESLWGFGANRHAAKDVGGIDFIRSRMVVVNFERSSLRSRQARRVVSSAIGRAAPLSNRLPLGSFAQGRNLRRVWLETVATVIALALAVVGLALLAS